MYKLEFELRNTPIAKKWLVELEEFINFNASFDDHERFYNFPHSKYTKEYVIDELNNIINTINSYQPVVARSVTVASGADDMNYLHHIFEVYHGLYDTQQTNEFFTNAPDEVKLALRNLNIWIHRFESLGGIPRFVATWYGKPCRKSLADDDFNYFTLKESWGTMYINYCEVGKNLFDLYHDNDEYIDPVAFKPLHYYSLDFTVRFTDKDNYYYDNLEKEVWQYYDNNSEFFAELGYKKYDPKLSLGWIPVADIIESDSQHNIIEKIGQHQRIHSVCFSK